MKIVICGSMGASAQMLSAKIELEKAGHEIVIPRNTEAYARGELGFESDHESASNKIKHDLIRVYFDKIKNSDAILVINTEKKGIENYIGGNTFLEMAFAHVLHKKIYLLNDIPEFGYQDEVIAMQPIIINGDLQRINL